MVADFWPQAGSQKIDLFALALLYLFSGINNIRYEILAFLSITHQREENEAT
jgi:hypothetical protein